MTQLNQTPNESNKKKKAADTGRDAYDDFLDMAEAQTPKPKRGARAKKDSAGAAKPAGQKQASASSEKKRASSSAGNTSAGAKSAAKSGAGTRNRTAAGSVSESKQASASRVSGGSKAKTESSAQTNAKSAATQQAKPAARSKPAASSKAGSASAGRTQASSNRRRSTSRKPAGKANPNVRYESDLESAWNHLSDDARRQQDVRRQQDARRTNARRRTSSNRPSRSTNPAPHRNNRPGRDAYDDYLDAVEAAPVVGRKKKVPTLTVLLSACIVCILCLTVVQYTRYQTFLRMKTAVEQQGFYSGTTVEDVDVSGMTLEEAIAYWEENIEPAYSQIQVTLSNGASFPASELGYTSDYQTVLANAWSSGRSGSLEERYAEITERASTPVSYAVTRSMYTTEAVSACVAAIAEQIDTPAEDAVIESFDVDTYTFQFTDEVEGSELDTEQLTEDMIAALESGGGTVELVVNAVQPSVTKDEISEMYGMIDYAVTNASSSSSNRLSNIKLALELINGTSLEPGETFSFNDVVGERTTERGFKSATAYSGGSVVNEVGGGICQVSTTLFNAAVKADLEIVERHNHSMTVSYVDKGKDAAVDWGNKDLKFTNTSDDTIYICCYLDSDKRVRIGIFGKLLENGEKITVEAETTGTISYDTVYQENTSLATGVTQVVQSGKKGYTAVAYKVRSDADGNEISRELLCKSTYRATTQIIEYGP